MKNSVPISAVMTRIPAVSNAGNEDGWAERLNQYRAELHLDYGYVLPKIIRIHGGMDSSRPTSHRSYLQRASPVSANSLYERACPRKSDVSGKPFVTGRLPSRTSALLQGILATHTIVGVHTIRRNRLADEHDGLKRTYRLTHFFVSKLRQVPLSKSLCARSEACVRSNHAHILIKQLHLTARHTPPPIRFNIFPVPGESIRFRSVREQ